MTAQTLFERDWAAISKGQAIASKRTPDLDRELVIYANARFSYRYILYDHGSPEPWLEAGLAAAERRGDDANKALLLALNRAVVAERQQQWEEAARWYRQVLEEMPGAAPATRAAACFGLGYVAREQRQWAEAARWYRQALDMPGAAPDTRARACLGLGYVAAEQQQWEEAAQWYRQVLEEMPGAAPDTRARACLGLGVVAERQQQWAEAAQWYQEAFNMPGAAPDTRARACHGLGYVAFAQKNVREARQHYSRAIELQPTRAIAYRNRGLTWAAEVPPDYERALADARHALELDPKFEDARRDVERYEQALKQQQLNSAFLYEQALKRAREDARRDVELKRALEDARRDVERYEQASKRRNRNRPNRKRNQGR